MRQKNSSIVRIVYYHRSCDRVIPTAKSKTAVSSLTRDTKTSDTVTSGTVTSHTTYKPMLTSVT